MKFLVLFISLCFSSSLFAQESNFTKQDISVNKHIDGTLLTPNNVKKPNLAIIIAGSGPTDRDGNQNFLKNNSLKKLAVNLTNNNIATYRYDKRIVKQLKSNNLDKNIIFDHFVTDAKSVIDYFKNTKNFNKIYVIGHSQGSLVGMLAAKDRADGFISLAGAGQSIDQVIIEQVNKTAPNFTEDTKRIFKTLKEDKTTTDYPMALSSIFNIEIQKFMINWMKYNPTEVLSTLNIPILVINGTKDLQVSETEAKLLKEANKDATLKIIENMNHVLVTIEGDDLENSKSYAETQRPIAEGLIDTITNFIK
ncbi:alpha/beta hydrolase [Mesoflavibacter sp. SCSIO 43206]|uniref:alpha/beta hydrolase n=1 Tax=Mesoflavibacter sp. SCSIO 43206 TaxID=2779362 RepID=UPI001CA87ABD|nr:alpha/beta hydrolase [Mesoflavibacter sp. SCSIO 43206]UAB75769.1 alpha/beta hydrolase [Mesoflavibacter sp. SCSIO 43206]